MLYSPSFAQEKCGTVEYNKQLGLVDESEFQNWMKQKLGIRQRQNSSRHDHFTSAPIYTIPVVVHVIHRGEAIGVESNIPDAQILNQIETLNQDFRRTNSDQINTPDIFLPVATDVEIEFTLAKRDPEGLPSTGIVRIQGSHGDYSMGHDAILKSESYWPADEYLNIWVAPLAGGQLGWAQYPMSNLPGMNTEQKSNGLTDGVVIDYEYFGTGHNADDFSKGRTTTHEIGHWLGLRHIWGDGACSVDDYCEDTPLQGSSTLGCPSPNALGCNDQVKMFQNYMDYTNDVCMNIFTLCQADRMRIVTENSPRRVSLLSSQAAIAPPQVDNDLGVRAILAPLAGNCDNNLLPSIEIRNYGTNNISSFQIEVQVNDETQETLTVIKNLSRLAIDTLDFSTISLTAGIQTITYKINQVNGVEDGNSENDCRWISANFLSNETIPFVDGFDGTTSDPNPASDWIRKNNDGSTPLWSFAEAPNLSIDNEAAVLNFFNTTTSEFGKLGYLISPALDFSSIVAADLNFKYAYASKPDVLAEALIIAVSIDCGATFPPDQVIFERFSPGLGTTGSQETEFIPDGPGDWLQLNLDLSDFAGNENVVIAFIGQNGNGNNLYLDDIEVISVNSDPNDMSLAGVNNVPLASCINGISSLVEVKNTGTNIVDSYIIRYSHENGNGSESFSSTNLTPGKSATHLLTIDNLVEGYQPITFIVESPNGEPDNDPSNNTISKNYTLDEYSESIPLRETFGRSMENGDWIFTTPEGTHDWDIINTESSESSAFLNGFNNEVLGTENWLISPVLDFTQADKASVFFDLSYANRIGRNERLQIFASTTCGQLFNIELYNKQGPELAVTSSETGWEPQESTDWKREFINLNELAGKSDVRVAFVVTNQNGNNLYLDNIEFYADDNQHPLETEDAVTVFPNPVLMDPVANFNIAINFNTKDDVKIRITNLYGEVIVEDQFDSSLNQIYEVRNLVVRNGIYLVNVHGQLTNITKKIVIRN